MRRFEVWLDCGVAGRDPDTCIVEMADDATEKECDEACRDALESLIENLDTGWREIVEDLDTGARELPRGEP